MSDKVKNFKELRMWQKGIEIVTQTYDLTKKFPKEEVFGLMSQVNDQLFQYHLILQKVSKELILKKQSNFYILHLDRQLNSRHKCL